MVGLIIEKNAYTVRFEVKAEVESRERLKNRIFPGEDSSVLHDRAILAHSALNLNLSLNLNLA